MQKTLFPTLLVLMGACGGGSSSSPDGGRQVDGGPQPDGAPTIDAMPQQTLTTEVFAGGLDQGPIAVAIPPGESRVFIAQQGGTIMIADGQGGVLAQPFLNVGPIIDVGGERGLLGMAFAPDYATSKRFFITYTAPDGDVTLATYTASDDPDVATPTGEVLLEVPHPRTNHNGGWLGFGPDGYLYMSTGDGGGGGDPDEAGQRLDTLAAKLLRLDVDGGTIAIPPDNPFVGMGGGVREEIWAYGLRNAWRNSFDPATGYLYIADVGQGEWEEINVQIGDTGGQNYGWDDMEGAHCYEPSSGCNMQNKVMPDYEYPHPEGECVIGGVVYHGTALPELVGMYVFGDYERSWLRSFRYGPDSGVRDVRDYPELDSQVSPTCFGEDPDGEILVCNPRDGAVLRLVRGP
jgi:glucose/arabinose dehydrogenase